jgi:hypothetical protein
MSEQREGIGSRGLQAVIGLGFLMMGPGVFGRDTLAARAEADPSPTITVLLYSYAQVSAGTLRGAEREASRILREAGVETVWQDCPTRHSAAGPPGPCQRPLEPAEVVLRILPSATKNGFRDTVFGYANLPAYASVYYDRAVLLARSENVEFELPIILGFAMAHELGHLLLGSNSHSESGIMQGQWGRKEIQRALVGCELFTAEEASRLRAEARSRARLPSA